MGKLLFFLLIGLLVWWLVKGLTKTSKRETPPGEPGTAKEEDMVACARCGVNMPRSEARADAGKFYCVNNPHCTG